MKSVSNNQCVGLELGEARKDGIKVPFAGGIHDMKFHPQTASRRLQILRNALRNGGNQLAQQLQPLRPELGVQSGDACHVSTGMREVADKSGGDGVRPYLEHDGNS
jgi:hypothetical protein